MACSATARRGGCGHRMVARHPACRPCTARSGLRGAVTTDRSTPAHRRLLGVLVSDHPFGRIPRAAQSVRARGRRPSVVACALPGVCWLLPRGQRRGRSNRVGAGDAGHVRCARHRTRQQTGDGVRHAHAIWSPHKTPHADAVAQASIAFVREHVAAATHIQTRWTSGKKAELQVPNTARDTIGRACLIRQPAQPHAGRENTDRIHWRSITPPPR